MTKVVKFTGFAVVSVLGLFSLALGEQVYKDRSFCKDSKNALLELHDFSVKMSLQASIAPEQKFGFKHMMDSKAVFLTKLREYSEMKTDIEESLKKSKLTLLELKLDENSKIPEFSEHGIQGSELNASEAY